MLLVITTMAGFLSTFMATAVNIALPLIESEFSISAVLIGWIPLAYVVTQGAGLMPAGQLSDMYGRKRIFFAGSVVFTVFTVACALAPSAGWLIALRLLQGAGSALLFSTSVALVTSAYPLENRGRALGLQISGTYLGMTLGPALGGIITHNVGWRGLFWIIAAVALMNVILTATGTRGLEWRIADHLGFDVRGALVYAVSLPAFLVGLSLVPGLPGVLLIAVGVVGLGLFVWWEARAQNPILRVDLFSRNRVFAFSSLASLINYSATAAMAFLISLYLQYPRGLDAQTAGFVLVAGLFVQAALSPVAGRLIDRVSARLVASGGMAACALGLFGLSFLGEDTPYWRLISFLCLLGLGFAFFAPGITHAIMGSVEKRDVSVASATLATVRTAGQNLSLGLATLVLAATVGRHEIGPADYPNVLSSVRITFAIFTGLCLVGLGASLIGRKSVRSSG